MREAICFAIDLGQLLQRGQAQIDHGEAVDRGRRNIKSTENAKSAKQRGAEERSEAARLEFERRKDANPRRYDQDILKDMAGEIVDGRPRWGSIATLNRYRGGW